MSESLTPRRGRGGAGGRPHETTGGYSRHSNGQTGLNSGSNVDTNSLGERNARSHHYNRRRRNRGPRRARFDPYPSPARHAPLQPRDPAECVPQHFEQIQAALPMIMRSQMKHEGKDDTRSGHDIQLDPVFQQVIDGLRGITRSLRRDLSGGENDDILERLLPTDMARYEKPRIGVCGDSGHGKSRLIGALLGDPGLVVVGHSGRTATRVPLEYKELRQGAQHKYESEIVLMTWDKFHDRVKRSLLDLSRGLFIDDPSEDATEVVLATSRSAREFFSSLFYRDPRFQDEQSMRTFLKNAEDPVARDQIIDLAKTHYDTVSTDRSKFVLKRTHSTSNAMWKELFPWTFGKPTDSALPFAPWPMVERIALLSAADILQHVVLLDLPGLDDHTYFNAETAHRYLQKCILQVVVHSIGRIIDGGSALQHIRDSKARGGKSRKIILVPTMKDLIGHNNGIDLDTIFKDDEKEELSRNEIYEQSLASERDREYSQYASEWLKFRNMTLRVRERDRRVIKSWKDLINDLEIFPTSADHYEKNLAGYSERSSIPLLPQDTGIPRLMKYLVSLRVERQYQGSYDYANVHLASAIASLNSRLEGTQSSGVGNISLDLSPENIIKDLRAEFLRSYDKVIIDPLMQEVCIDLWIDEAKKKHRQWQPGSGLKNEWHPNTYRTWITRKGCYSTRKQPQTKWNDKFLREVKNTLLPAFDEVEDNCDSCVHSKSIHSSKPLLDNASGENDDPDLIRSSKRLLLDSFDGTKTHIIKQYSQNGQRVPDSVLNLIDYRKANIGIIFRKARTVVKRMLLRERERTTMDDFGYYFREAMNLVYDKASAATCPGEPIYVTQIRILNEALSDKQRGPFAMIKKELTAVLETQRQKTVDKICKQVQEEFDSLKEDLKRWQDREPEAPVRKTLQPRLAKMEKHRKQIVEDLESLGNRYNMRV